MANGNRAIIHRHGHAGLQVKGELAGLDCGQILVDDVLVTKIQQRAVEGGGERRLVVAEVDDIPLEDTAAQDLADQHTAAIAAQSTPHGLGLIQAAGLISVAVQYTH